MSYIINRFNGTQLVVLDDGTIDTSTSLGLVGRNYVGYGETQNENFVFLLENFANSAPPSRPITGQIGSIPQTTLPMRMTAHNGIPSVQPQSALLNRLTLMQVPYG